MTIVYEVSLGFDESSGQYQHEYTSCYAEARRIRQAWYQRIQQERREFFARDPDDIELHEQGPPSAIGCFGIRKITLAKRSSKALLLAILNGRGWQEETEVLVQNYDRDAEEYRATE